MALPRRQQRLLEAIDHQITSADPRLAWMLGTFGRLWADEPLPAREQLTTRRSRFWPGLWQVLALSGWAVLPLTELPMTDAAGRARARRGSTSTAPDQDAQGPDGPAQSRDIVER
jgi:hypothetical protein